MRRELGAGWAQTELGPLFVACTERGVCYVGLQPETAQEAFDGWRAGTLPDLTPVPRTPLLDAACSELEDFARGARRDFDTPLDLFGTDFQRSVWSALRRIPYGATRTYAQIAGAIGNPGASRAVGLANNRNVVPLLVPCHRVVAANGLGGFGGGLEMKRRLLSLEGALLPFG